MLQEFTDNDVIPVAIVLMGNFLETYSMESDIVTKLASQFNVLGDLFGNFPHIAKETELVIVPGPKDPVKETESRRGTESMFGTIHF